MGVALDATAPQSIVSAPQSFPDTMRAVLARRGRQSVTFGQGLVVGRIHTDAAIAVVVTAGPVAAQRIAETAGETAGGGGAAAAGGYDEATTTSDDGVVTMDETPCGGDRLATPSHSSSTGGGDGTQERAGEVGSSEVVADGSVDGEGVGGGRRPAAPERKKKKKRGSAGGRSTNARKGIGQGEQKRLARMKAGPSGAARSAAAQWAAPTACNVGGAAGSAAGGATSDAARGQFGERLICPR